MNFFTRVKFPLLLLLTMIVSNFSLQAQTVSINWDVSEATLTKDHWAVNDYQVKEIASSNDAGYKTFLQNLNPSQIRLHQIDMMESFTNSTTRSWNVAKMRTCFQNMNSAYGTSKLMFNIVQWPSWLAPRNAALPAANETEFLNLVGSLVRVMRDSLNRNIEYWEVFNELDGGAYNNNHAALYTLTGKVIDRIKSITPTAKCGGTAFAWANYVWRDAMLDAIGSKLSFLSYHSYPVCGTTQPGDSAVMSLYTDWAHEAMVAAKRRFPNLLVFLDEFNVNCTWTSYDARMSNSIGAIFFATNIPKIARRGVDGIYAWHTKDGIYGLLGGSNERRPQAVLYEWGNQLLTGVLKQASSTNSGWLEVIPIVQADGSKSILLLNKRATAITYNANTLIPFGSVLSSIQQVSGTQGTATTIANSSIGALNLPPRSLTLIRATLNRASEINFSPPSISTKGTTTNFSMNFRAPTGTGMQVFVYLHNPAGTQIMSFNQWRSGTGIASWNVTTPVSNTPGVGRFRATYFSTGYGTLGTDSANVTFVQPAVWIESAPATVSANGGNINVQVSYAAPAGTTGMNLRLEALSTTNAIIRSSSQWVGNSGTANFNNFNIPTTTSGTGKLRATYFASGWGTIATHEVNLNYTSPMIRNADNSNPVFNNSAAVMYPNPTNRFIYVDRSISGMEGLRVEIMNVAGQSIISENLNDLLRGDDKIDLGNLQTGLYFATLRDATGKKIIQHRFVKE